MDIFTTLTLAVSALSMTLTKAKVFKSGREWIKARSAWLGGLVTCPYCTSHWIAFGAVAVYRPRMVDSGVPVLDLAVTAFAVVALAAFSSVLIYRAFAGMRDS